MNSAVSAASSIRVLNWFILAYPPPATEMWGMSEPSSIGKGGRRPPHVKPPAHLSKSPPLPEPEPEPVPQAEEHGGPKGEEPTRYGDWENKGICWDF
jgi:hypothetical protein